MKISIAAFLAIFSLSLNLAAQDSYHQDLIQTLSEQYQVDTPTFVFFDNEEENLTAQYFYGDASRADTTSESFSFTALSDITVHSAGVNPWDAGLGIRSLNAVATGDVVLLTFWARGLSDQTEVSLFAEDAAFDKQVFLNLKFTSDWSRYFIPFTSTKDFAIDELVAGFHIALFAQQFEFAGFTGLNYGPINMDLLPSTISPGRYGGFEPDAAWRAEADARIDSLRMVDLQISVVDGDGNPIEGATISVEMQQHAFGFGSAFVTSRFAENRDPIPTYVEKITDLDGAGHGFNVGVMENSLKWDGWEEQWIGTPEETVSAIKYLDEQGIEMRGHTLMWPGWDHMPVDMLANQSDLMYMRDRINQRLDSMLNHSVLSGIITEWDVLNEITQVRDLEGAFMADPNFATGREIYSEIIAKVNELQPDFTNYINDYVVLSGGPSAGVIARYQSYLDEIVASGVKFDGIGFQCHISTQPISILQVQEQLDDFYVRYGKRAKVTEFDINPSVPADVQGAYLADFLTMIFSHPSMDAFLMWGFWDGNHWKGNAPLFDLDWNLKPSGQAFIDKVFGEWWTSESTVSDTAGMASVKAFKGTHQITVEVDDAMQEMLISTDSTNTIEITFETTAQRDFQPRDFEVFPNPVVNGSVQISGDRYPSLKNIELLTIDGKLVSTFIPQRLLHLNVPAGVYQLKLISEDRLEVHRLVIQE